ncbi:acyltransferase [Marinibactrum halimedae]|uniref:Acyltransferase n=1 Tax=Marinibactrum halimedae TaxID=1444977 RepID=A0AA37WNF8_9GAMM|nr:acyltransferase [Marinibactrum halimedae]MCD9458438.1 acyltransferase [Marinibactrum halimedae]GLS26136.1 acyltransferase [Marinibactrum halimedae]
MLNFLPAPIVGVLACLLMSINILFWCALLFLFTFIKLIFRGDKMRKRLDPILIAIAENWISGNKVWMAMTQRCRWQVEGVERLRRRGWYLVNANHQSWADIFVLQSVLNRKIPFLKFFLKQELAKVPLMGQAWWALDFPFMRRFSKEYLEKNPNMRGKDLEATRKACERFSLVPTSVMNFLEGTRFSIKKHQQQKSPFRHLLLPKAGGIAFAVNSLGDKFHSLLDVTIVYPQGVPSFWDFLSGRMREVIVQVRELEIPDVLCSGDYQNDEEFRHQFQQWVQQLWVDKDQLIGDLLAQYAPGRHSATKSAESL